MRARFAKRPTVRPVFVAPTDVAVIRRIVRQNALDPRLEPTDRHMQRWAVTGDGLNSTLGWTEGERVSKVPPLSLVEAELVDRILADSPDCWQRFVYLWYMSSIPVQQIADRVGVVRQRIYEERRLVLAYLLGRLRANAVRIPSHRLR